MIALVEEGMVRDAGTVRGAEEGGAVTVGRDAAATTTTATSARGGIVAVRLLLLPTRRLAEQLFERFHEDVEPC